MPAVPHAEPTLAVAIVGAGPRGTSVLERLTASADELLPPGTRLTVHVIDPHPPGAGSVWRTDQAPELLMNTVASQVTLYTDDSVDCSGPIHPGPSLYEWAKRHDTPLGPDAYPTRAQYGRYLRWVFTETVTTAPPSVEVVTHPTRAIRLDDSEGDHQAHQTLTLSDGHHLTGLHAVVLTQGHLPTVPTPAERALTDHARRHGLRHLPPANPADLDLTPIAPGEPVLLRGLGLNFFDHMALLTEGRGGRYTPAPNGGLRYIPSGNEPRLYAGSRRGVPHQARGDNAKGAYGRHQPAVLTDELISRFRKRADSGDAPDFLADIWPLVAKEVETVYYETLLRTTTPDHPEALTPSPSPSHPHAFRERFLDAPHRSPEEAAVLRDFGIPENLHWSWDHVSRPASGRPYTSPTAWRTWLLGHLREDAAHAALGNVNGPVKAALDVLRDLRNELRLVVDHGGLTGTSRRDHLDRWYTPLNAFLSIGPPRRRIEELTALIEAGALTVVGPRMEVAADARAGRFVAHSPDVPGSTVSVTTLVEARLPEPDVRRTADDLLEHLLKTGAARPHTVDGHETGGLDVTPRPYRLIGRQGRAHARRFAFGVPTEGVHWVTAAGARPGVDSVTLSDADAVARAALGATGLALGNEWNHGRMLNLQALIRFP
ncbi:MULTISPECIES: FAD/NAD(P)-binding domain-containing protein [unclassified Streptomyces]|uniref:FAD/NAD(P)-binding protein n=1 Tax=unclassified Streptomyces TaxID=2593676 RepID=UPI00278C5703|nr:MULTISPECIES: FAD/NAD(P)-binding protein [unclassified Streptomyces]